MWTVSMEFIISMNVECLADDSNCKSRGLTDIIRQSVYTQNANICTYVCE